MTSYRAEISFQRNGPFTTSIPALASEEECTRYVEAVVDRSPRIADYRVVAVSDKPTHTFQDGKLRCLSVE